MEEKKTFMEKAKNWVVDNEELILIGVYVGLGVVLLGEFYKGIRLYNEKTRLEIASLRKRK